MKYVKIALLVIIVLAVGGGIFATTAIYSTGFRKGRIAKISQKGIIFKTYEGELTTSNKGVIGEIFYFSVNGNDTELLKQLENTSGEVKLSYAQKYMKMSWAGDTEYFITKVEKIE